MNALNPIKLCYRCDAPVHVEPEEIAWLAQDFTCWVACRAKLRVAVERLGQPLSQSELTTPTPPPAVSAT